MRRYISPLSLLAVLAFGLSACTKDNVDKTPTSGMDNSGNLLSVNFDDPHSFAHPNEVIATHLDLDIEVNFETKSISGTATYQLNNKTGANKVYFDTDNLEIENVTSGGQDLEFLVGGQDIFLGRPLEIDITPDMKEVTIAYRTRPGAKALQWLDPVQTAGKQHPFLFTQSQAILARSWIPCQDGPGMRFTYNAKVKVPSDLMALMSASNPQKLNASGVYEFEMAQPIPAYLMALSVGDLRFASIGGRTGVYAEPSVLEAGVYEFADMEKMLSVAEELYGPYRWDRYDVIVLPPSFPFGGMENPRLTFATPTILAGDRSLTSLIAHELAHSWSGNLVTNANWNDFWLNEGFTVYFERRIMEELYGQSYSDMLKLLGYQDLLHTLEELGPDSDDTKLKLELRGRDPDDGMTDIAYEKGNLMLCQLEAEVGREKFDAFLRQYFDQHAFLTMTTEGFIAYAQRELFGGQPGKTDLKAWIYQPGLPAGHITPESDRFEKVDAQVSAWTGGTPAASLQGTADWTTHEWLHFIRHLPAGLSKAQMADLDQAFGFTASGNSEILAAWFEHVIRNDYAAGYPALESFLMRVGRRKFLKPLYKALAETPAGKERGRKIYAKARANYHSVSVGTIDEILDWK